MRGDGCQKITWTIGQRQQQQKWANSIMARSNPYTTTCQQIEMSGGGEGCAMKTICSLRGRKAEEPVDALLRGALNNREGNAGPWQSS